MSFLLALGAPYLDGLPGQLEGDPLADLGGQLVQHIGLEAADHHLAEAAVQLVQVGGATAVPLPPPAEVSARKEGRRREMEGGFIHLQWHPQEEHFVQRSFFVLFCFFKQSASSAGSHCSGATFATSRGEEVESLFLFNDQQQVLPLTRQKSPVCNFHKSSAKWIFFFLV